MPIWKRAIDERAGHLFHLSNALAITEWRTPGVLVPVSDGTMMVFSDYSGQHKQATHEAHSFLITTDGALNEWLPNLEAFRARWLPDGRRLSFKKLKEPVRWRALQPFLTTASELHGNLMTILVDRRIKSFIDGGPAAAIETFNDCFATNANHGTVEKMFRLASFVALIISGLREQKQASDWVSDHDEALDTHAKREQFSRLASYLTVGLTGWREPADHWFTTTESTTVPPWAEDVAAIPDIVAGAYCQLSSLLPSRFEDGISTKIVSSRKVEGERAQVVSKWLATTERALHPVLLRLELDTEGNARATAQVFAGTYHRPY
jgi:hypothetical protein